MILTLGIDSASFARLTPLRERHFPARRNLIPIHVSLFQQLPEDHLLQIMGDLADVARTLPLLPFDATGIMDLGGGAAIDIFCPPAGRLQADLRRRWSDILTPGDDRERRLRVTIQNKVPRAAGRATQERFRAGFRPWGGVRPRSPLALPRRPLGRGRHISLPR